MVAEPTQLWPEFGLLAASVALRSVDGRVGREAERARTFTGSDARAGDRVAAMLAVTSVGYGVSQWVSGDRGELLEVFAESLVVGETITAGLKVATRRDRPHAPPDGSRKSFPSSHATLAFVGATVLARAVDDSSEAWPSKLGWLAMLPAAFIATNRVEAGRHHPSDVTAGALVGMVTANWIYNAHFGLRGTDAPSILTRAKRVRFAVEPFGDGERMGIGLSLRF